MVRSRRAILPSAERVLPALIGLFVALIAVLPMGRLLVEGVMPGGVLDLSVAARVLDLPVVARATLNTIESALAGMTIALVIGTAAALLVTLTDFRGRGLFVFCMMMPVVIPPQITALAWMQLLGPGSPLLKALGLAPPPGTPHPLISREGVMLLLGVQHAPLVLLAARAGLRGIPAELVEAARAAGARPLRLLRTVILPLAWPGIAAGAALAFVACVGNFGIPALIGIPARYPVLTTVIYQRLSGLGPSVIAEVAVIALIAGAIALAGLALQSLMLRGRDRAASGGTSASPVFVLGKWRRPVAAIAWGSVVLLVVAPLAALLAASLVPTTGVALSAATVTLANYAEAMQQAQTLRAFRNSFLLAGGAGALLALMALPLGYFLVWKRSRTLAVLIAVAEMPYALPGVVLAIACILVFLKPLPLLGITLYDTAGIIFVAYLARFLALGLQPVGAAYLRLDRSLDEAARMAGARLLRRLAQIVAPLVAPAVAAGFILVFLIAVNELTVSALLWSTGKETLGVLVYNLESGGEPALAAAVSVLSVTAVLATMLAASRLARRLPAGVLPWRD